MKSWVKVNGGSTHRIVLEFSIICDRMVWESPTNDKMVSIQFQPTWFDTEFQRGMTRQLTVSIILPSRVPDLNYTAWDNREWDQEELTVDGWKLTWHWGSRTSNEVAKGECNVGVAFSKEYVDKYYKETFLEVRRLHMHERSIFLKHQ